MNIRYVFAISMLFVANVAKGDFIYTPSSSAADIPNWGRFPTITIRGTILQDLGDGLYGFQYLYHTEPFGPSFGSIDGTLLYENGEVTRWSFVSDIGSQYFTFESVSRFDGTTFFESYEVKGEAIAYSGAPGSWVFVDVPPPPPPPEVPLPAGAALFLIGLTSVGLIKVGRIRL